MKKAKDFLQLSASDLSNFLSCKHLTELDKKVSRGELKKPEWNDPHVAVLRERGFQHENDYIEHLAKQGFRVSRIPEDKSSAEAFDLTVDAMKSGADIIIQGVMKFEEWFGKIDILKRIEGSSLFGNYSYEVMDTKLSHDTKAGAILQLCLYSELVSKITGISPEKMYVVTPGEGFVVLEYRVNEYQAYYRLVRDKLLEAIKADSGTYPEPVLHCDVCRWWEECTKRRRADDHLSFVAGLCARQRKDLEDAGVATMEALANSPADFFKKLQNTNPEIFERIHKQAQIQVKSRSDKKNHFEVLPIEKGRGLSRLPEPTDQDVFFDIEGDVFVGAKGLEYLLGITFVSGGKLVYDHKWAFSPTEEKAAFEWFIDDFIKRLSINPNAHIYHYAPYEPGACKRLAQRYSTREDELDRLLRAEKFVDLYGVVRQGVRASVEQYSIKDLEKFTGYTRKIALSAMGIHKRALEHSLELEKKEDINDEMKAAVLAYNHDDTDSTYFLREWLEKLRTEVIDTGTEVLRPLAPEADGSEAITERDQQIRTIKESLVNGISVDPKEQTEEEKARVVLSELMSFYRREEKVSYWEVFRLKDMNPAELFEDKSGIEGLTFVQEIKPAKGLPTHIYEYPYQEVDFRSGDDIIECGGNKVGKLESFDPSNRRIAIKKMKLSVGLHPKAVWRQNIVSSKVLEDSSLRVGGHVAAVGLSDTFKFRALKDIILRKNPRLTTGSMKINPTLNFLDEAKRIALSLDNSYLPIQGPPGAGKSYTGSHIIAELVSKGHKVGVTANSHKVISGLMGKAAEVMRKRGISSRILEKVAEASETPTYPETTDNAAIETIVNGAGSCLIGGTSWLFARETLEEKLDYLIVDEAGQLSLSNVVSVGACAKNIIFLGDPQQLEQPIQACHPEGADKSALEYIIGEHDAIPEEKGLFLPTTFRCNLKITNFCSELFYEGRLHAEKNNALNSIKSTGHFNEKSLSLEIVEHVGNSNYSIEEVEKIKQLVDELCDGKHSYSVYNHSKEVYETGIISLQHIMVIAPYNAQVQRLKSTIANLNCGTVDKFQGGEAPVVIYSMTTSSLEEAPRGMDFLYSANRLNVAVSRAQCLFIMVASNRIFDPECKSPKQMKLANSFCRFVEMVK